MAQYYQLQNFVVALESWGLTDVLIPFLLVFTIVFAILQKTKIFGAERKNINIVLALALGLLFVIPHASGAYMTSIGWDPVLVINNSFPGIAVVIVAILMLLLLIGLFGWEAKSPGGSLATWIFVIALIIVVYVFGAAANWWRGWDWFTNFFGQDAVALVIILLVFGIVIAFITSEPGDEKKKNIIGRLGSDIGEFFKK